MNYQQRIYNEARKFNFPDILCNLIAAQGAHETGNFTSPVFLSCQNSFGYKSLSTATSCPGHESYKQYANIEQSTDEVCNWILRRQNDGSFPAQLATITTPDYYAQLLKNAGYFEDTAANYANGIENYLQTNLTGQNGLILAAAVVAVIIIIKTA